MSVPPDRPSRSVTREDATPEIRRGLEEEYPDVYIPEARRARAGLAGFVPEVRAVMEARLRRRAERARSGQRIGFLEPDAVIPGSEITVGQARTGHFEGEEIPEDLRPSGCKQVVQSIVGSFLIGHFRYSMTRLDRDGKHVS